MSLVILHILAPARVGGLERVVHALTIGHHRAGHEVHVGVLTEENEPDHPFVVPLRAAGVAVHPLHFPSRAYLRERREVAKLIRRIQPDVVHTHGYRPDVLDAPVARRMGVPTVSTVHGFTGGGWKNRLYERLQRRSFRRMHATVAVSRPLADQLAREGVRADRLHLLPNAWAGQGGSALGREAARSELGIPADRFHLGWVGRVTPEKGADVLIDALGHLPDLPLTASVLGDGRERPRLEAQAASLGTRTEVRWHGMVPDASRFFAGFDLFVLSSRTEGTPIVLFEAMAAGVPIVATTVGGVPDVVTAAEALLVPPENPEALARAIRTVYADPAAAATRAAEARERLRTCFDVEEWLDRYEAIYRQIQTHP